MSLYKDRFKNKKSEPRPTHCDCGKEIVISAHGKCARCYMNMVDRQGASASSPALKKAVLHERDRKAGMTTDEYKRDALKHRDDYSPGSLKPKPGLKHRDIDPALEKPRMSDEDFFASKGFAKYRSGEANLMDAMQKKHNDIAKVSRRR